MIYTSVDSALADAVAKGFNATSPGSFEGDTYKIVVWDPSDPSQPIPFAQLN